MRHFTLIIFIALTLISQTRAQSTSPGGTEVVVPWATNFYTGPGNSNVNFCDSLYGVAYNSKSPDYSITTDGGNTWRTGKKASQLDLITLMCSIGRDSLVAVRDSQFIYHSFDGGYNWTLVNTLWSGEKFGYGTFYNHKYGIIFPSEGGFLTSTDLGVTWSTRFWDYGEIKSPPRYERGYLFVREQSTSTPGIVYSSNNGISWEKLPVPASLTGFSYAGKSENGFYVVAANRTFYLLSPTGEIVKSFLPGGFTNSNDGHAYVNDDEIWMLSQGGQGLRELRRYSSSDTIGTAISLVNRNIFFNSIIPTRWDRLVIFSTGSSNSNAIMTFNKKGFRDLRVEQIFLPGKADASSLFFVNGSKGFAGLVNGKIIMTSDGGYSWQDCTMPTTTGIVQKFVQRSETEFIAICGAGLILETSDGGNTWNSIISPMQKVIRGVAFKGRDTIYFCTSDSVFKTTPQWQQFTPVQTGLTGGTFSHLDFYDELNGSAIYRYGYLRSKIFYTTDGGNSWETHDFHETIQSFDPSSFGIYYSLSNSFTTWSNETVGGAVNQDGGLVKFDQKAGGLAALYFDKGDFYYNFGNNVNFSRVSLGQTFSKTEPVAADANTAFLLTNGGRIFKFYKTTDSPTPSSVFKISPQNESPYEYHDLSFKWEEPWSIAPILEYNFQLAAGDPSNIVEDITGLSLTTHNTNLTSDSTIYFWRVRAKNLYGWGDFNKWYTFRSSVLTAEPKVWQTPLTNYLMTAVILPDGSVIAGDSLGQIARADSPTGNWTIIDAQTSYPMLRLWRNPNNNIVFAYTQGNRFFFSTNRGVKWYTYNDPFGGSTMFYGLTSAPQDRYYAVGQFGTIYRGIMLSPFNFNFTNLYFSPYTGSNFEIASWGENRFAAVGELGSVTISDDKGASFRHIVLEPAETYRKVSFAPDGTVVILNHKGERRISTDAGITWTFETFETKAPVKNFFTLGGISVIVDEKGGIYTSLSPTLPWQYSKLPEGFYAKSINIGENKILLPSQNGKIFYVPLLSGNPLDVEDEVVITDYALAQNFPNPFNPETVIRFALPVSGFVKGVVYDILGREVATLINGEKSAGSHEIKFNAAGLPSGIYIFRLQTGKQSAAIKMILMR